MNCPICNAQLGYADTECPCCGAPVQNSSQQTRKPAYGATQQTGYAQTGYAAPQQSISVQTTGYSTQQPYGQTGYAAPQQTGYTQTGYGAPQQTGYAQPGYGAPQQTGYAQTGYGAPQQTGYAQTGYAAPQQTGYYAAPRQQGYAQQPARSDKSRIVYQILCFFLGGLGIQDFYAGRNNDGIIHLSIFFVAVILGAIGGGNGIPGLIGFGFILNVANGLWALVQIFTVKNDGSGNPMK